MTATIPNCPRCKRPISAATAATLGPADVALHAECSRAASEEAWRLLDALARPLPDFRREPTFRVVGVRPDGGREVLSTCLDLQACKARVRWCERNRPGFARFVIEQES